MSDTAAASSSGGGKSTIQLTPMEVPKASDVLAGELRERILTGEFAEGAALPPERELVVQTQMSRTTVREALRILEVQGLIRIKTGRSGGAFVQRPGEESIASSVSLLIRGRQIRLSSLLETREAIEPYCARLAAMNRTADDLAVLEAANEAIADEDGTLPAFLQANVDWHVAVATASHNELLTGFMAALSRAIYAATENERFVDAEVRRVAVRAHRSITEAIRAQDPKAAVRRMTRHVHGYADAVLQVEERTEITVSEE
ncbi:GntR domain-containing protein [Streptomyces albus]|uniref:GntR domain-containing protein n=1 Tax=Streptomyces albus (strain ATCC 21838 / DSM 41398 / FERM P-419 / JCM 4703 / NBRC 107858) TaxID=1081613 RepID=A0A0B5F8W0_STRA4|nr:GntR domain-containing protein [Streptomyces albus]AOU81604.1 GntR domain-containing protein [Streptomyces albus]AYN37296.1 GntR domain-containing protein [Streptomyces albus]